MSKNTLVLDNPVLINGKEVKELTYDPQEITAEQFSIACAKASALDKSRTVTLKPKENDYSLHLYLGMMAIIAVNPNIDVTDLEKVKGFDVLSLTNIGTFFILRKQAAVSTESSSDEQSENTANTSTQAPEKSEE
jgi:hypothetical protein